MKLSGFLLFAFIGAGSFASSALALDSKTTTGPCQSYTKASETDLKSFEANPSSILGSNPLGGVQLASLVKSLVVADSATVPKILELLKSASPQQVSTIGSGLGQAVAALNNSCDDADKKTAESVAALVGPEGNDSFLLAFNNAVNGTATFAVNDAGVPTVRGSVGGANSGGSQVGGSTSNAPSPRSIFTINTTQVISFSGVSVTCTTSVSPTHTC